MGPILNDLIQVKIADIRKRVRRGDYSDDNEVVHELTACFEETQHHHVELQQTYYNAMMARAEVMQNVSMLSPMVLCQSAIEIVSGTGFTVEKEFLSDIERFSNSYDDYIREKIGKVVGPWNGKQIVYIMHVTNNPVEVSTPYPEEYEGDTSDFPEFNHNELNVLNRLRLSLKCLGGLLIWNVMLFVISIVAFQRYDAR